MLVKFENQMQKKGEQPKTWAELLKQYEKDRTKPPPKEYYYKEPIIRYEEGGIFAIPAPEKRSPDPDISEPIDTHIYCSTTTFDPPPEQHLRSNVKPKDKDNLGPVFHWKKFDSRHPPQNNTFKSPPSYYQRDFNAITCQPNQGNFKTTVNEILKKREISSTFRMSRQIDPISNTFHTPELEKSREEQEAKARKEYVSMRISRLPQCEQRCRTASANIVTGEIHGISEKSVWNDFGESNVGRAVKGQEAENKIVARRETQSQKQMQRVNCRYNNGRITMQRDWNIINGSAQKIGMDVSVKAQPSAWAMCQAERIVD